MINITYRSFKTFSLSFEGLTETQGSQENQGRQGAEFEKNPWEISIRPFTFHLLLSIFFEKLIEGGISNTNKDKWENDFPKKLVKIGIYFSKEKKILQKILFKHKLFIFASRFLNKKIFPNFTQNPKILSLCSKGSLLTSRKTVTISTKASSSSQPFLFTQSSINTLFPALKLKAHQWDLHLMTQISLLLIDSITR